jgi:hypothetical protein
VSVSEGYLHKSATPSGIMREWCVCALVI